MSRFNPYSFSVPVLVKCIYEGFCSEIKQDHYYLAYQSHDSAFVTLEGIRQGNGLIPTRFGKHHFIVVK